jgi:hypothetical protein
MRIKHILSREQLRWSDIGYGAVDSRWPAISFAHGTSAVSQIKKLQDGDVVLNVCAGQSAERRYKRKVTGISVPHYFTAKTADLVEPELFRESLQSYGGNRWPESIACKNLYQLHEPMPLIDKLMDNPRIITVTRGRYLADIAAVPNLWDRLADYEVEELSLYRSPQYIRLSAQPRHGAYRRAGWSPTVPPDIQDFLIRKVRSIFASVETGGVVYEYQRPERIVQIDETTLLLLVLNIWNIQGGRCIYCKIPLETSGLAQASIDRIDNENREYGRHNIQLTCWECNRGKHGATHEAMLELWEKRKRVWQTITLTNGIIVEPQSPDS